MHRLETSPRPLHIGQHPLQLPLHRLLLAVQISQLTPRSHRRLSRCLPLFHLRLHRLQFLLRLRHLSPRRRHRRSLLLLRQFTPRLQIRHLLPQPRQLLRHHRLRSDSIGSIDSRRITRHQRPRHRLYLPRLQSHRRIPQWNRLRIPAPPILPAWPFHNRRSHRLRPVFPRRQSLRCPLPKLRRQLPKPQSIPSLHSPPIHPLSVHIRPVRRLQIHHLIRPVLLPQQLRMMRRNIRVIDDNIVARITPQRQSVLEQIEDKLIPVVEVEGQIRHVEIEKKDASLEPTE